jgi:uncharacterized protein (UPF0548 family)
MGKDWSCGWHTDLVFSLTQPSRAAVERQFASASRLPANSPRLLTLYGVSSPARRPAGFSHDRTRSLIGNGERAFAAAKQAFVRWTQFDLGWVRACNPEAPIKVMQIAAVEAHTLGLWSLSFSRIVDSVDDVARFGFIYSTTAKHVEHGEERFLLEFDHATGDVWYDLEAVSRPQDPLAKLGFPVTRYFQKKFARDSHRRMREAVPGAS